MEEKANERVYLELTREQAYTIENACELLARLSMGEFKSVTEKLFLSFNDGCLEDYFKNAPDANNALELAAKLLFGTTHYGVPDLSKIKENNVALDIWHVLEYTRCWHDYPDENHESPCFKEPVKCSDEPLPVCKIETIKETQ